MAPARGRGPFGISAPRRMTSAVWHRGGMWRLGPLALLGVLALSACGSSGQEDDMGGAESAAEASTTPTSDEVLLEAPADAGTGRCMAPSADVLAGADIAFDGTV